MSQAKIDGLAHVGIFVRDLEVSKAFYTDVLECQIIWENTTFDEDGETKAAFVQNGSLILELIQYPEFQPRIDGLIDHIAFRVHRIEEIRKRLGEKGILFEEPEIVTAPYVFSRGSKWILFRGPDGERLEITEIL